MTKDEALKMAIEAFVRWEDTYKADCTEVINACKEALEQPTKSITEGATMFKQVGNSPKPSPPPPIHTCTYSRTINQEYPRKCVHCGKVEALEQPTVAELNDEYLRDTHVIGLEQPAQEPLTRAQQVIRANNKALEQPTVSELNNEYLRDTNVIGLEQSAQEPVAWIDVNDRLPKQLDIVLVSGKHKSEKSRSGNYELVDTATYYDWTWEKNGTKGWLSPRFGSDYDEVTHWMPLPKYPLYTHPHQWQGLTDDEICALWTLSDKDIDGIDLGYTTQQHYFAALVEQALKEKNHG